MGPVYVNDSLLMGKIGEELQGLIRNWKNVLEDEVDSDCCLELDGV